MELTNEKINEVYKSVMIKAAYDEDFRGMLLTVPRVQ